LHVLNREITNPGTNGVLVVADANGDGLVNRLVER
jgi:hypothetical protein